GQINEHDGAVLTLTNFGGTLDGVSVNGDIDGTSSASNAIILNGLVLNGTLTLGNPATNDAGGLTFGDFAAHPPGSLTGNGTVVFGAAGGGNGINNASSLSGAASTLTIGPNITIRGKNGAIGNQWPTATILYQGHIIADTPGGTIQIANGTGTTI